MGVSGKLEVDIEIKSCGYLFYELWSTNGHQVPNFAPHKFLSCQVQQGIYGKPGSVVVWGYALGEKEEYAKEIVEADEANKSVKFELIVGDLLQEFKTFTTILQVIPKGELTTVKWIAEFEKLIDDGPYPTNVMDFMVVVTRDIEAHHLKD